MRIKVTLELLVLESWKINKFLIFENGRFKILDEVGWSKDQENSRQQLWKLFISGIFRAITKSQVEGNRCIVFISHKTHRYCWEVFFNDVLTNNFVELYIRFSRFWRYSEPKEKQRIFHRLVKLANVKFECAGIYRRKARVLCVSYLWRFLNPRKLKC